MVASKILTACTTARAPSAPLVGPEALVFRDGQDLKQGIHVQIRVHIHICIEMFVYIYIYMLEYEYIYICYICTQMHMHMCIYIYVYAYVYVLLCAFAGPSRNSEWTPRSWNMDSE